MKRAIILLVLAVSGCRGWTTDKPPVHLNWNMDTQEKGKAYRANTDFADKRMMRMPVEGTVARGYLHDDDQLTLGVDEAGKPLAKLPDAFKADQTTVARGQNRFAVYCAPCHGKDADGKGIVAARGPLVVPPPSFHDQRLISMPAGQIYAAIKNGVNNGNMPSYAAQIPEADRWAIVSWLCTMQTNVKDPIEACANKKPVDLSKLPPGQQVYVAKGCNACHSLDGSKSVGPTWKGLFGKQEQTDKGAVTVDEAYLRESITQPNAKVVTGFPPAMPALPLSEQELTDVIKFIETLK